MYFSLDGNFKQQMKDKPFSVDDFELIGQCFFPDDKVFRQFLDSVKKCDEVNDLFIFKCALLIMNMPEINVYDAECRPFAEQIKICQIVDQRRGGTHMRSA